MSLLTIRKYGDPVLREKCMAVVKVDDSIKKLMDDMAQTMYSSRGVGLAAPQVGIKQRVIVVDGSTGLICIANPVILSGEGKKAMIEGCLSIPGIEVEIRRASEITVEGLDRSGKHIELSVNGLAGRAIQHEIDHLDGKLIIDYLSLVKRQLIKKKLRAISSQPQKGA